MILVILPSMTSMTQNLINCHVNDALDHINQAEYGDHFMIVYPDLATLRKLYSSYTHKQLEENNEIVVINPFYETIDSAKQVLCRYDNGIDNISKYENENALVIADSLEEYLGDNPLIYVKKG